MDLPKFINEEKLSELTGKSISTLQQDRWRGIGVPYYKIGGSVRYSETDVQNYLDGVRIETKAS